jgi:hypothetical protein
MKRDQKTLITVVAVVSALAGPVWLAAQDKPQAKLAPPGPTVAAANYNFLIGSGLLCNSDDSTACPAVAKAANGETIEINGAGALNLAHQSVTAAGAFAQKTPPGDIVLTGVWAATGLESFESYGLAPWALQLDYPKLSAFGPLAMGLGNMAGPMAAIMAGPFAAGGWP